MNRLISIKFSHYNEKARWALDRCGIPFVEEPHLPVTHMPFARAAAAGHGKADKISSPYSTPVLVTETGPITDSTAIVAWASEHPNSEYDLMPAELMSEIQPLDRLFSEKFGAHTRRIAYHYCLQDKQLFSRLAPLNVPGFESTVWRVGYPLFRRFLWGALGVTEERALRSADRIRETFAQVDELLADGRRYLVGDQFTLADLSFAALSAPVILVEDAEGYDARLPTREEAPAALRAIAEELRQTAAGNFTLRMFAEERGR
ncbi:MAG: glutathione S-transferase [Bradymonadia bacterium]|jgi:glutathione S-transferase